MDVRNVQRISLGMMFFLSGFGFSSWASRIPTIKENFDLNDATLGTILLSMPIGSLIGLPISGWLVSRFNSRIPLLYGFIGFVISIFLIGRVEEVYGLVLSVVLFSFMMRILNIALNTQAITLQKQVEKKINGSFHGLWSSGGIVGIAFTTWMISKDISMSTHLMWVAIIGLSVVLFAYANLISGDRSETGNKIIMGRPDPYIFYLGVLVFLSALVEGGMFDWSGIYFKEIVGEEIFTIGYLTFMFFMAMSRFASDHIIHLLGLRRTYLYSAIMVVAGMTLAISVPQYWFVLAGFCLVGFGVASVVPMTMMLAGSSTKYSPGMAVSIISTYSIVGMLLGPPLIGYLAHLFTLQYAFIAFCIFGLCIIPVSSRFFKLKQDQNSDQEN